MSLKIVKLRNLNERESFFNKTDFLNTSWIVSDLKSKQHVQKVIKRKIGYFEDDFVLRVQELWSKLLFRNFPEISLHSSTYIQCYLDQYFFGQDINSKTIMAYIEELMPILSHSQMDENIEKWFVDNEDSFAQWGNWYKLAKLIWIHLFQEKAVCSRWQSGFLVNKVGIESAWRRPLVFDLGPEILGIEAELIQMLARVHDVIVLEPAATWSTDYPIIHMPYDKLKLQHHSVSQAESIEFSSDRVQEHFLRFKSSFAEVKEAVFRISQWVQSGVPFEKIIVLAPDIEEYWDALRFHLEYENIPINKARVGRLVSVPIFLKWRSRLHVSARSLETSHIEQFIFNDNFDFSINFEDFISNYTHLFSSEDLFRVESVANRLKDLGTPNEEMSSIEFIDWAIRHWDQKISDDDGRFLSSIIKEILSDVPQDRDFRVSIWLKYLDELLTKIEFEISPAQGHGLDVQNLLSAQAGDWTHRIFLGLSEEQLKGYQKSFLKNSEIMSLEYVTGHLINHPDRRMNEYQVHWLNSYHATESIFSFSETNFLGKELTPSLFWIRGRIQSEGELGAVQIPQETFWDYLQYENMVSPYLLASHRGQILNINRSLSAGSIESFVKCPFIFAAEKIFRLKDPEILDLDPDPREKGTLLHSVLEKVKAESWSPNLSLDEIQEKISRIYEERQNIVVDVKFRELILFKFSKIVSRFLIFERKFFSETKSILEKDFVAFIDPAGNISFAEGISLQKLTGKIDRIELLPDGNVLVIDYKMNNSKFRDPKNWIEDASFQLFIYAVIIESGLLADKKIAGVSFYGVKDFTHKGFISSELGEFSDLKLKKWSSQEIQDQLKETKAVIKKVATELKQGEFNSIPFDLDLCQKCKWSRYCRASHLEN